MIRNQAGIRRVCDQVREKSRRDVLWVERPLLKEDRVMRKKKPEVRGVLLACIFVYDNNKRNWERREEDKSNVALVRLARKAGVQKRNFEGRREGTPKRTTE